MHDDSQLQRPLRPRPPTNDPVDDGFVRLGQREAWGGTAPFGLSGVDRRQHLLVLGKSGTGKSSLLKNIVATDIRAGRGVVVIDPHGDLSEELLQLVPNWRRDHLVYFDPADEQFAVALNLLHARSPAERHRVVAGVVAAFKSVWADSFGPRLSYILTNGLAALTECSDVSLLALPRMLVDDHFRDRVVRQVRDPITRQFWTREWPLWDARFRSEAIAPVLNKVNALLGSPVMRAALGQVRAKWDARWLMDHRRIFIANLSKGRLGAENANLLGSMLVAQFSQAAMSRADVQESDRVDCTLVVDEFASVVSDEFQQLLSEARKYRLATVLCGQMIDQASDDLQAALFGNVGSIVSFRVGESDATQLAREFANDFTPAHFTDLDNFEVCVKLSEQGRQRTPFRGRTFPPMAADEVDVVGTLNVTRQRYAVPRGIVDAKIERWFGTAEAPSRTARPKGSRHPGIGRSCSRKKRRRL